MAVIGINYDGGNIYDEEMNIIGNDMVYDSVRLHTKNEKFVFDSGNFVKDWFDAKKKYSHLPEGEEPFLSQSSDCNHFQGDGGKFDSAYLHFIDDKPTLLYVDRTEPNWWDTQRYIFEDGWEFFVEENTKPTWEELREICK